MTISDVVTDVNLLPDMIKEQLNIWENDVEIDKYNDLLKLLEENERVSWILDYNGLTICFNGLVSEQDEVSARIITLSDEEYPDLLKDKYKEVPTSYGVELIEKVPFYYDVTGDGKIDRIEFLRNDMFEEGKESSASIYINGVEHREEIRILNDKITLLHLKNDKNVINIEAYDPYDDEREIVHYNISDKTEEIGRMNCEMRKMGPDGEHVSPKDVLTNPESFYLSDAADSDKGCREYYVGEDGMPEVKEE